MKTYTTFWEWIQAIQEMHPHTSTIVTILDNSIVVDSRYDNMEIAQWNNTNETGNVTEV